MKNLPGGIRPAYIIFGLWLMISAAVATAAATTMHRHSQPMKLADPIATTSDAPKYLVLIVLDGARPDYFGLTPLPHVDALRVGGTQFTNAMDGILEAETPSGHTPIATGSSPARNGILG
ncbi:MAG: alkaline phosphatase family protein, partial [Chloroflexota bacterium]|nr:alkaline phosphatase family protein [Chloroflexota bacterium]